MAVPGGWVDRPRHRVYRPTFWSLNPWAALGVGDSSASGQPLAIAANWPTALSADGPWIDLVVARNARRERAFGFLPLLATPAAGNEPDPVVTEVAIWFPSPAGLDPAALTAVARTLRPALRTPGFTVDRADVEIAAITAACRDNATVMRLRALTTSALDTSVTITAPPWCDVTAAVVTDARERPLHRSDGSLALTTPDGPDSVAVTVAEPYMTVVLPHRPWPR
jgi:hypothetical protein